MFPKLLKGHFQSDIYPEVYGDIYFEFVEGIHDNIPFNVNVRFCYKGSFCKNIDLKNEMEGIFSSEQKRTIIRNKKFEVNRSVTITIYRCTDKYEGVYAGVFPYDIGKINLLKSQKDI